MVVGHLRVQNRLVKDGMLFLGLTVLKVNLMGLTETLLLCEHQTKRIKPNVLVE